MNDAIFSAEGRLTRRDYVLTIAALLGGVSLLFFVAVSILLPFTYLSASAFFREAVVTFWILLFMGAALIFTLLAILLPLSAIPATVRRLQRSACLPARPRESSRTRNADSLPRLPRRSPGGDESNLGDDLF